MRISRRRTPDQLVRVRRSCVLPREKARQEAFLEVLERLRVAQGLRGDRLDNRPAITKEFKVLFQQGKLAAGREKRLVRETGSDLRLPGGREAEEAPPEAGGGPASDAP